MRDVPSYAVNEYHEQDLRIILDGCREILNDLKAKLDKSQGIAQTDADWRSKARQAWSRITWDQVEIERFRDRITSTVSLLNLLMSRINQ